MRNFKAAVFENNKIKISVVFTDSVLMKSEDKLMKRLSFFQDNFFTDRKVVLFMLDSKNPVFFGDQKIVDSLNGILWKNLPWKEYQVTENINF